MDVVSPSDRPSDVHTKPADYFSAGTRSIWVVEPETRAVCAYRSLHDIQVIGDGNELDGGNVLPRFRCPVKRLFPQTPIPARTQEPPPGPTHVSSGPNLTQ